jgi:hypothetical protein
MDWTNARELDRRETDGIEVTLLWRPEDDALLVTVADARSGETFELQVEPAEALEVFEHPYAYAARLSLALA